MNPVFKYPVDEQMLRSKLLETQPVDIEQAWEKFELYLSQQKPLFTTVKKNTLNLMIHPTLLFRVFLAGLIVLSSVFFYRQLNSKFSETLEKLHATSSAAPLKQIVRESPMPMQEHQSRDIEKHAVIASEIGSANIALPAPTEDTAPKAVIKKAQVIAVKESSASAKHTEVSSETTAETVKSSPSETIPSTAELPEESFEIPL
jgi:hypothetical protein